MTALPDRDVVFVRFQNEGTSHSCLPYFIAIDEHSNSVGQLRHAQTDKVSVSCTYRHGCTAAQQQHVICPSCLAAAMVVLLCSVVKHVHALCFALSHVTCRHLCWINRGIWACLKLIFKPMPHNMVFHQDCCFFVCFVCFLSHQPGAQGAEAKLAYTSSSCMSTCQKAPSVLVWQQSDIQLCCEVVSVRGTLSLEDCVTDFLCEPVDLDEWIKEVDSSQEPRSFQDRVPEVKPASKLSMHPIPCAMLPPVPVLLRGMQHRKA